MHNPEIRIVRHGGTAEEVYQGALDTVLEEIALIRADREVEDGIHHEEKHSFLVEGILSEVTLTTTSITSWSVTVVPEGRESVQYGHTPTSKGVLFGEQAVPEDLQGASLLTGLHRVLFELNEAGSL